MSTPSPRNDPVWERALDWLLRMQEQPRSHDLRDQRDAWLAESDAHLRAYRKAERVWRLTGLIPPTAAPAPVRQWRRRRWPPLAAAALAAGLAVLLAPGLSSRWWADFHTGVGQTRQVSLADGSVVDLDAESAIDVTLSSDRRGVALLAGRAFFRVAPDPARPFTVSAGGMTVTVTGTAFDVALGERDAVVEVQSGRVAVAREGGPAASLQAGGRAHLSRRDGTLTVETVPVVQVGLWRQGRLVVNGATVAEVVAELRRHYPGVILLPDDRLAARHVTGVFDLTDPAAALDAVLLPHGGGARRLAPGLLLVSAR